MPPIVDEFVIHCTTPVMTEGDDKRRNAHIDDEEGIDQSNNYPDRKGDRYDETDRYLIDHVQHADGDGRKGQVGADGQVIVAGGQRNDQRQCQYRCRSLCCKQDREVGPTQEYSWQHDRKDKDDHEPHRDQSEALNIATDPLPGPAVHVRLR
jgi:hypothetical protein